MPKRRVTKKEQTWRKDKIIELSSDGLSNRAIADKLQIPHASVDKIVNILKLESRLESPQNNEDLPFEYNKTIEGVRGLIRYMADIMNFKNDKGERTRISTILGYVVR